MMGRYCYCSKILPGKSDRVREHSKNNPVRENPEEIDLFWDHLKMTGFESWLQHTPQGDVMIHGLEGESLQHIFKGLRELISEKNPTALRLHQFYLDALGKDYQQKDIEPTIECVLDLSLPDASTHVLKRGFVYPLLPHKEQEHRQFRKESMGPKKERHLASMKTWGVNHMSIWLQNTPHGQYIVIYSEHKTDVPRSSEERRAYWGSSTEWQEIAKTLMDHTGLSYEELTPDVEWLTH